MRIFYDVGIAAENLRPAERVLQVGLREIPERIAFFHHVLHFLSGVGSHDEIVRRICAGRSSRIRGRHLRIGTTGADRRKNDYGANDCGEDAGSRYGS